METETIEKETKTQPRAIYDEMYKALGEPNGRYTNARKIILPISTT